MLKFKITTPQDLREAAAVERRRQLEEERKGRIFNAKQRLFGLDQAAIQQQIAEKNKQKYLEAEVERRFLDEESRRAALLQAKQKEFDEERKRREAEDNFYRMKFQRKEDRREHDLNDPNFIRNSQPARVADDDPRLGISSAQIFVGEDITGDERRKNQKNQQRAWLEQQIQERKQAEENKRKADQLLQEALIVRDKRALQLDCIERHNRKKSQEAIHEYNRNLALQQHRQKLIDDRNEEEDNMAEIYNLLTSDMLTENPDVANSCYGPGKKIAYLYRGMSPQELYEFRRGQREQIDEKARKRNQEIANEKQWDNLAKGVATVVCLKEKEMEDKARIEQANLIQQNHLMAVHQNRKKQELSKLSKTSDDFYAQFNTTTR